MSVFASDDFSSGSAGADLSTSAAWVKSSGGTNGRLRYSNAGRLYGHFDNCLYLHNAAPAGPDVSVSIDITPVTVVDNSRAGVACRHAASGEYYRAEWHRNGSTNGSERVALWRMGDTSVLLDSLATRALSGTTYTLRLEVAGATLRVFWNDAPRIEYTDPTPIAAAGAVGITNRNYTTGSNSAGLHIDNFVAQALGSPPPARRGLRSPLMLL